MVSARKRFRRWPAVCGGLLLALGLGASGCGSSEDIVFTTFPGPAASLPPVARADLYTTGFQNSLTVPASRGVLSNDTPNATAAQGLTITFPTESQNGGQITLADSGGGFTYIPPTGFLGRDIFGYELANQGGVSRTIVTIEVTQNQTGIFVDSRSGSDRTGSAQTGAPFATVQAAVSAAGPGADIVVLPGTGTYTGTVNLLDGQRLLSVQSPLLGGAGQLRPTLSGPLVLADGNTVDSLRVVRTSGIGIDGDGQHSGTITNCEVTDTTGGSGIQVRAMAGSWRIEDNSVQRIDGAGIDLDTQGDSVATVRVNRNTVADSRRFGLGIAAFGTSQLTVQASLNELLGNGMNLGPNGTGLGLLCAGQGSGTVNLRLTGNLNDGVYGFAQASLEATLNVQNFAQLEIINEGDAVVLDGQVNDVATIPGLDP